MSTNVEQKIQLGNVLTGFSNAFGKLNHVPFWKTCWYIDKNIENNQNSLRHQYCAIKHDGKFHAAFRLPQRSNLAPSLFLLFINDLLQVVKYSNLVFADYLKVFKQIESAWHFRMTSTVYVSEIWNVNYSEEPDILWLYN